MPDNLLLDAALQLAARGVPIIPLHSIRNGRCTCPKPDECAQEKSPGKHPRIKTGRNHRGAATTDPATIEKYWNKWPDANVGIVTGHGLAVVDLDGVKGARTLAALVAQNSPLPLTLQAKSGRLDGGRHLYYRIKGELRPTSGDGLDLRADGGLVVVPPSMHLSGRRYEWVKPLQNIADMPEWLEAFFANRPGNKTGIQKRKQRVSDSFAHLGTKPAFLVGSARAAVAEVVERAIDPLPPIEDVAAALSLISNPDVGWDEWSNIGLLVFACTAGSADGQELFLTYSRKSKKHRDDAVDERWEHWQQSPPTEYRFGSLVHMAREVEPGWEPPSRRKVLVDPHAAAPFDEPTLKINGQHALPEALTKPTGASPLIKLNDQYAVIGDVGGKCLVLGWVPSKVDETLKVPSFQSFKSFSERYASTYILTKRESKDGETIEEPKQIGSYWLKWTGRRSYEGIELEPLREAVLPGNVMNLWSGFAMAPASGAWGLMQRHIVEVLAGGDVEAARYIARFAAWAVQNPGERAEVALVFRGGKGSGKGTFANAVRRLFGQHGLQIFNSKHLVGSFNGHLRNCLLLFADEAFWAGDKQGESVLKGMLTESVLMIEQKGVDATQWRNRLHVIMAANADWVVPASHDERRYAVFDVSDARIGDRKYFQALHAELRGGGLAAMLHDLQRMELGDWHPRDILHNEALRKQKERSMAPLQEWWVEILQLGRLPHHTIDNGIPVPHSVHSASLLNHARDTFSKLRDLSPQALGRFLTSVGGDGRRTNMARQWSFPPLNECRAAWEKMYGLWPWECEIKEWQK